MNDNIVTTDEYRDALHCYQAACEQLYRSELALHDSHQTHVDEWIAAAADGLHASVLRERAAAARLDAAGATQICHAA